MKLSKTTLALLKNLAMINTNLLILPGSKLSTISANKTVAAEVETEEEFDTEFGIYDLSEFLGVVSLFDEPDLDFSSKHLTISEGRNSIRYLPADKSVLVVPKNQTQKFPADAEVQFELAEKSLLSLIKSASVLKVPFLTVLGDGEKLSLVVHDKSNPNSNRFVVDIGETDMEFEFHIKTENLKMLPETYEVEISSKKIARFKGEKKSYLLACEQDSTFNE